jgi:hypothetical protein
MDCDSVIFKWNVRMGHLYAMGCKDEILI